MQHIFRSCLPKVLFAPRCTTFDVADTSRVRETAPLSAGRTNCRRAGLDPKVCCWLRTKICNSSTRHFQKRGYLKLERDTSYTKCKGCRPFLGFCFTFALISGYNIHPFLAADRDTSGGRQFWYRP